MQRISAMQRGVWGTARVFGAALLLVTAACGSSTSTDGSSSSSSSSGGSDTTRSVTGSVSLSSLSTSLSAKGAKTAVDACASVSICCTGYTGEGWTVATLNSDCTFTLALPLENYCYCGFFTGTDVDGDTCPDTYANYTLETIPVFEDVGGLTDDIDLGECDGDGCANDVDGQVDVDQDGTANSDDTDDDGDGTADTDDDYGADGLLDAWQFDLDGDALPDIFESIWADYTDTDDDGLPNFLDFDLDGDGTNNTADTDDDGDGTADDSDTDDDADGFSDDDIDTDTDGDGIWNLFDGDPDGDSLFSDFDDDDDGDGTADTGDTDDDGDGLTDEQEADDADSDGFSDLIDTDDDGDGSLDTADADDDGDGTPDASDPDTFSFDDSDGQSGPPACESDFACQQIIEATDPMTGVIGATSCNASGQCETDCNQLAAENVAFCAEGFESSGGTCTNNICTF